MYICNQGVIRLDKFKRCTVQQKLSIEKMEHSPNRQSMPDKAMHRTCTQTQGKPIVSIEEEKMYNSSGSFIDQVLLTLLNFTYILAINFNKTFFHKCAFNNGAQGITLSN